MFSRVLSLLTALILLLCAAAGAENEDPLLYDFGDFILRPGSPPTYVGEKSDGMPLFAFTSGEAGDITLYAVNAVWSSSSVPAGPEEFAAGVRNTEAGIRAQYESGGYTLRSFDVKEAAETEYWGRPALRCDAELVVGINDTEAVLVRRAIQITGEFGTYLFSLSAWSPDYLEEAAGALERAVEWK